MKFRLFYVNLNKRFDLTNKVIDIKNKSTETIITAVEINNRAVISKLLNDKIIISEQAIIAVSNDLEIIAVKTDIPNLCMAIIQKGKYQVLVIVFYATDGANKSFPHLSEVISEYSKHQIVCVGDANTDHLLWSPKVRRKTQVAKQISDIIIKHKMKVINPPNENNFTFQSGEFRTWIDVLFTNMVFEMKDLDMLTDHRGFFVTLSVTPDTAIVRNRSGKRMITNYKFNMPEFITSTYELDKIAEKINNFPNKYRRIKDNHTNTMTNKKLRTIRKKIHKIKKCIKRGQLDLIFLSKDLRIKEFQYKEQLKNRIDQRFKKVDTKTVWRTINRFIKPKDTISGKINEKERYSTFLPDFKPFKPQLMPLNSFNSCPLQEPEITTILNMSFKKSSGKIDKFTLRQWQIFWKINKINMVKYIQQCFIKAYIPQPFKRFGISLIPKMDNNLRPIRLASYPLQVFDKILLGRLQQVITTIINIDRQYALKKDGAEMMSFAVNRMLKGSKVALLDISKAFDNIDNNIIVQHMKGKIDEGTRVMIQQFLQQKILEYKTGDITYYKLDNWGTSQGSALGPITFMIGLDYVIKKADEMNVHILSYADDMAVKLHRSDNINQSIYLRIQNILSEVNLKLNETKTREVSMKSRFMFLGKMLGAKRGPLVIGQNIHEKLTTITISSFIKYLPDKVSRMVVNAFTGSILYGVTINEFYRAECYEQIAWQIQEKTLRAMSKIAKFGDKLNWKVFTILNISNPFVNWMIKGIKILAITKQKADEWPILKEFSIPAHDMSFKNTQFCNIKHKRVRFKTEKNSSSIVQTLEETIRLNFGERMQWHELVLNTIYQIKKRYKNNILIEIPKQIARFPDSVSWMEITNIIGDEDISWRPGYLLEHNEPMVTYDIKERLVTYRSLSKQIITWIMKLNLTKYYAGKTLSTYLLLYPPKKINIRPFTRLSIIFIEKQIEFRLHKLNNKKKDTNKPTKTLEHYLYICKKFNTPLTNYYLDGSNNEEIFKYVNSLNEYLNSKMETCAPSH